MTNSVSGKIEMQFYSAIEQNMGFAAWKDPRDNSIRLIHGPTRFMDISSLENDSFVLHPFNISNQALTIRNSDIPDGHFTRKTWHIHESQYLNYSFEDFSAYVGNALKEISSGKLKKVVVSRQAEVPMPENFCPVRLFLKAVEKYPEAYVSLISVPEYGTWLGATPELFLSVNHQTFEIHSLAGTLLPDSAASGDFIRKNQAEQEWVSVYLRNLLTESNIDFYETKPEYFKAGELKHFLSRFKGKIDNLQSIILLQNLHPTPAIGGFPKPQALSFLSQHEKHQRELFGGFLGYFGSYSDFSFYVNLRCVKVLSNKLLFFSGAGIIEGSEAEKEWEETGRKMDTLRKLL